MGALQSSVHSLPDLVSSAECVDLLGHYYDEAILQPYYQNNHNKIPKLQLELLLRRVDVFLTHDWGEGCVNHGRVSKLNSELERLGLVTWFDEQRMKGDIKQQMAEGIDNATCVVVFITSRYLSKVNGQNQGDNCRLEFSHAFETKPGMVIPVVMEATMKSSKPWPGQFGMRLNSLLYVDGSGDLNDRRVLKSVSLELFNRIMDLINHRPLDHRLWPGGSGVITSTCESKLKPLEDLSCDEVCSLLTSLRLGAFVEEFRRIEVDGESLTRFLWPVTKEREEVPQLRVEKGSVGRG